ncbi:MAG: CRISPR-associated protein Cas4 [Firmicutes bacterium]|nr:CRISPR-associated protein Cas4 [Bacillota bacterium]
MDTGDLEPVMLSALEHYSYCPRQCALIHCEQIFDDNVYTLRGHAVHKRVHEIDSVFFEGGRVEFALPLWSEQLGLIGQADVVEFHNDIPYPIEYKYGKYRKRQVEHAALQLCGQGMCLEEMMNVNVPKGAIYYHSSRRRYEIEFIPQLRDRVQQVAVAIRAMISEGAVPLPPNDERCTHCSLNVSCMPAAIGDRSKARYLVGALFLNEHDED